MKSQLKFVNHMTLLALALCFSAGLGKAQDTYKGKFTLPFEAHWGEADLPAGDYTISMRSAAQPYLVFVRGEGNEAIIMAMASSEKSVSDDSHLTIVDTGGNQTITELAAGQLGLTFSYAAPKMKQTAESRLHAENIPVVRN